MAVPSSAKSLGDPMDPTDIVDYEADMSGLLQEGENFSSITVALLAEAVALGFNLGPAAWLTGTRTTVYDEETEKVLMWASVDPTMWGNSAWNGSGSIMAMEITGVTDSTPTRRYQRTCTIPVAHQ